MFDSSPSMARAATQSFSIELNMLREGIAQALSRVESINARLIGEKPNDKAQVRGVPSGLVGSTQELNQLMNQLNSALDITSTTIGE